jgi:hypothetical protein
MKIFKKILFSSILIATTNLGFAQCKSFSKNTCMPQMDPYVSNENYNSTSLIAGDDAELVITFYEGQEYRLLVCAHPILENVEFKVSDATSKQIYSSTENNNSNIFDFKMESTQQLTVRISVPLQENPNSLIHEGCVTIITGHKELSK